MISKFFYRFLTLASRAVVVLLLSCHANAANELAQSFTLDGQLMLAGTTTILSDSAAVLKIDILDPTKTCILYEEQQTVNTVSSDGYFSVQVGSVTGAAKRTSSDPGLTMVQIFQNTTAVTATSASGATCAGNTYTPTADAVRYFRITVTPSSTNVADVLSPDTTIDAAPMAMVAQTLQGYQATDFLAKAGLPSCSSGTFLTYDGTNMTCAGVTGASGGTVTSITAGTGLTGGTITTSGTLALATSGATAGTYGSASTVPVVTVDTYGRVTNVTTASISGSPSGAASGDLAGTYPGPTVNGLSGTALSISSLTSGQYLKYNGTNWINSTLSVSDSQITYGSEAANTFFAAPNGSAGTPAFRAMVAADLPTVPYTRGGTGLTATPANGQIAIGNGAGYTLGTLTAGSGVTITNTAGAVTIAASGSGGTVTSVSGTAPISIATGTSTPVVSISQATTSTDGYLTSADWNTFNSKIGSSLASGDIFVGNASGAAAPVALSGDATLSNAGVLTLANVATAGTYEKVVVNTKGLVTSGSSLGATDITTALGYTPVNKAGDSMTGSLTHAASTGDIYTAGSGSNTVTVEGPSTAIGTSYVLRLPTSVASVAGQVLTSDTSGNLSWSTPSTTATSYSGILPIANGGTNSSTALTGNQVMISSAGKIVEGGAMTNGQLMIGSTSGAPIPAALTAGSGITITNAANSITIAASASMPSLASGDIFVGNSSGGAAAVAMSGDVTMTNAGVTTVGKIQGTTVSGTTPTTAGQVFRYNGSAWTPNFVSMADLRSTITGATALTSCGSNQTLTWTAVADNLTCANIAISDSQITYGSEAANTFLAAPNGSAGVPTYRTIASADLPAGTLTGSGTANYIPYYSTASSMANSPLYVSSGNVGIGTTNPNAQMEISASNNSALRISASNDPTNFYGNLAVSWSGAHPFSITADGGYGSAELIGAYYSSGKQTALMYGNVGIGTTSPASRLHVGVAPTASANYGLLSLGSGAFDGTTTGFFVGNNSGTVIAANAASGYTGDLINLQIAGSSKFKVDYQGNVTSSGATVSSGNTTSTGNYSTSGNISTTGTGTITSAGGITDSSTTASTSSTTGALTVAGGVGVSGAIYTGSTINSTGNITSGADFLAAYGTAAAPSYAYTGDTTTGNYAPSAGVWAVSTAGSERMRINSSGYVGIGTTNPSGSLDVEGVAPTSGNTTGSPITLKAAASNGTATGGALNFTGGAAGGAGSGGAINITGGAGLGNGYSGGAINITSGGTGGGNGVSGGAVSITAASVTGTSANGGIITLTAGNGGSGGTGGNIILQPGTGNGAANGNVGIGTTAPTAVLSVVGASYAVNTTGTVGGVAQVQTTATGAQDVGPGVAFVGDTNGLGASIFGAIAARKENSTASNARGYLQFSTGNSATKTPAEAMRITSNGYVGMGTTNPAASLHVSDNGTATGIPVFEISNSQATTTSYTTAQINATATTNSTSNAIKTGLNIQSTGTWTGTGATNTGLNVNVSGGTANNAATFTGGSVGIGTTSPAAYLHVAYADATTYSPTSTTVDVPWTVGSAAVTEIQNTSWTTGAAAYLAFDSITSTDANEFSYIGSVSGASGFSPAMVFGARSGTTAYTERMRIDSTGYVGIGATSPSSPLHVLSSASGGVLVDSSNTNSTSLNINNSATSGRSWALFSSGGGPTPAGNFGIYDNTGAAVRLTINSSGYVGIGTTSPVGTLDVGAGAGNHLVTVNAGADNMSANTGTELIKYYGASQTSSVIKFSEGNPTSPYGTITFGTANGGSLVPQMAILSTGAVGIGTTAPSYTLHVVGTAGLSSGTAWTNASDIRLKDIQGDYKHGLDEVLKLHTVKYNYKKGNALGLPSDFTKTGFIAQEVQKVIPEAVSTRKDGYLELNVDPIHWAVVNAIKDLYNKYVVPLMENDKKQDRAIASVQSEAARQDKELKELRQENADIKAREKEKDRQIQNLEQRLERIEKSLSSQSAK